MALGPDCVYTLTAPHNHWYGPNGLPPIASDITIAGNGATIARSGAAPRFRLFFVGAGGSYVTPGAGTLTLQEVTISGGVARRRGPPRFRRRQGHGRDGGGGAGLGGAIFNMQGDVTIRASTLAGNAAIGGADNVPEHAQGLGGAAFNLNGSFQAVGSTLAGNSATNDGSSLYTAVFDAVTARAADMTLRDTVVADSGVQVNLVAHKPAVTFDGQSNLGGASPAVGEFNLVRTLAARDLGTVSGTALTADPLLGPLQYNGGPTQTLAPSSASPVVDQGSAFGLATDQRGLQRPFDFGSIANAADGSDIGAVEMQEPGSDPSALAFGEDTLVTLKLAARRIPRRGPVKVRVANGNDFTVAGKLGGETTKKITASRKRRIRLKAKAFGVAAHARKTVKHRLPKALRNRLARKGSLTLRLHAHVRDPAGNTRGVSKRVTLRLRTQKRR